MKFSFYTYFYLIWLVSVLILNINGNITFGYGLGDLYDLTYLIALSIFQNNNNWMQKCFIIIPIRDCREP